ncbi:MAG: chromosome segregation protein SMC, partial [Lachnospiraceae bacterium]|nr:chromosome segregation protein SMC [Lachnospiraceae bacterium]
VKEKIRADEAQAEHYKDRIRAIETEIWEKEQEIEALKAGSLKNQEEAAELKKAYNELQRKLQEQRTRISLYKKTAEENQQGLMDLLAEKDETTSRLSALNTLLSQENLRLQETGEQLKAVNKTIEEAEEKLKTLSGDEKDAESSLSSKKDELAELQRELDEADLSYEALRQEINDNNQKFQINRSRYETLRAVQEQYEGFNNAVRRVMEVRSRYPGICGVVSDLIRVDKKFRTAIEAALGGNYQNIVTEDQKTARDLISFLKESRSGRATFLPLDAVRPIGRLSDERILKEPGVYGTANTLTEADKRYDNVVRNLLERIVVVEDLKTASDLARKYRYQIRMVTLEGDILAVGGSMTGGSFKNNNHYLGRTEELEALSRTNERLKSETAEKEKELNLKKQLKESLQVETDDLREEIQDIILKLSGIRSSRDHQNSLIRLNRMESKELASRKEEILESIASHKTEKLSIEDTVKQLEALNASSDSSRNEVAGLLQEAETEEARLSEEAEALRLKQSEAAQREEFNEESLERLAKDIGRLEEEKEELNDNLSEISENTSEKEEEIRTLESSLRKAEITLAGMENDLKGYSESRDSMTSQQKAYFDQRDSLSTVISDLNREEVRLQSQQEKLEERIDNQVNYLWSEYELTPSEAEKFRDETLDNPSRIRRHAQELKTAIRQLGNVNVNAIEQYNEVSERYETMTAQYQDLKKAEEDLKKIIQDLDEGMRRQFTERFAAISDEYDRVFKELFGGGQGTLEIREGDILESDIQIISQPPGKKLQNMMQLSGGEKALSAIALIFAIQNLKPSPFCLLDEIEAALDDSNVGRFTGYLRKLTHSTQFIVITHRRGTMVAADRLYGITMQEKGVSALISVNLVEGELSN